MRVLHVTDCYLPRLGGIEMHVADLVRHQRERGLDAHVATIVAAPAGTVDPDHVHRLGSRTPAAVTALPELAALVDKGGYDVVHVHVSVWSPFSTLAARQLVRAGHPTLATIHSVWSRLGPLPVMARELLRLRAWPLAWSAVSDAAAAPLRDMLGPAIPVAVLGNAVQAGDWRPSGAPPTRGTEAGVGVAPGPLRMVSVMRLTRTKRAMPFVRMLRRVRAALPEGLPLEVVIVGDGPMRPPVERYLARHRMQSWVRLAGRLDRAQIRSVLATGDLYVAPAELESFCIAALEARTAGLPVVASSLGGVREFIRPGVEGLLGANDDELVAAMVRLLTDHGLRGAMARHNATVPPAHGWDLACDGALALYHHALAIAAAGAPATRPARVSLVEATGVTSEP